MHATALIMIVFVLVFLGYIYLIRRYWGSKQRPLYAWLIGVAIVWAAILTIIRFTGSATEFNDLALVFGGYVVGVLGMYIAVHIYKV